MLGSLTDADDAVQEAWLRLSRADSRGVENLRAWLTTVIARVCLNVLRSRESRREEPVTPQLADSIPSGDGGIGPEDEMLLADSVGIALLAVLDPEVVLRVDRGAGRAPARGPVVVRGATTVAARSRAYSRILALRTLLSRRARERRARYRRGFTRPDRNRCHVQGGE